MSELRHAPQEPDSDAAELILDHPQASDDTEEPDYEEAPASAEEPASPQIAARTRVVWALWSVIGVAVLAGVALRLYNLLDYQQFKGDQVQDAFVFLKMKHGQWPTLGPDSSVGGYQLPPTYYYLVFPFTLISSEPVFQLLPDFLASVATMLLLPLYCHRFIRSRSGPLRRLSAVATVTVWSAVSLTAIGWAGMEWVPYFIPLLVLLDLMILTRLLEHGRDARAPLWAVAGLVSGVLLAMHSTAMFVVPVFFGLFCLYHGFKHRRWLGIALAWTMLAVTLVPYLIGEAGRGFANTRAILHTILDTPGSTVVARISRTLRLSGYAESQGLLSANSATMPVLIAVLVVLTVLCMWTLWKTNRHMVGLLGSLTLLFLVIGSSYGGPMMPQYVLLLYCIPILGLIGGLFLTGRGGARRTLAAVCLVGVVGAIGVNVDKDVRFVQSKNSPATSSPSVAQQKQALAQVPAGATICVSNLYHTTSLVFQYLDANTTSLHHRFTGGCGAGDYELVPKGERLASTMTEVTATARYVVVRVG